MYPNRIENLQSMPMAQTLFAVLLLCHVPLCMSQEQELIFYSPKGPDNEPGVFGGQLETYSAYFKNTRKYGLPDGPLNITEKNLFGAGYQCYEHQSVKQKPVHVKSMSFDRKSFDIMIRLEVGKKEDITMIKGALCNRTNPCASTVFNGARLHEEIGPIAYQDSTIYFLRKKSKQSGVDTIITIELRKFEGCEDRYPVTKTASFHMNECSKRVTDVLKHQRKTNAWPALKFTYVLLAVPIGNEVVFFTQIENTTYLDSSFKNFKYHYTLYQIGPGDTEGRALYSHEVDPQFSGVDIHQHAGISYREGKLCWAPVDRLFCADWSESGGLQNVRSILEPGMAAKAGACEGAEHLPGQPFIMNLTTGVAIARTKGFLEVYFGCVVSTQLSETGGSGLIRAKEDGSDPKVYPLYNNGSLVYAGYMFVTDACFEWQKINGAPGLQLNTAVYIWSLLILVLATNKAYRS